MIDLSENQLVQIRDGLVFFEPVASSYKVIIQPLPARKGLEAAEAGKFEKLAEMGFQTKNNREEARETHGANVGIVVAMGPTAYKGEAFEGQDPWCEVGDVVFFKRYGGDRIELPPGSGIEYMVMNDNQINGRYDGMNIKTFEFEEPKVAEVIDG